MIPPEDDYIFAPRSTSTRIPHNTTPLFPNKLVQNRYDKNYLRNSDFFIKDSTSNNSSPSRELIKDTKKEKSEKSEKPEKSEKLQNSYK